MKKYLFFATLIFQMTTVFGQTKWIKFDWQSETIYGKFYDKVAMTIPLKIEGINYNFCGQFDLGATTTMLYENSFNPYLLLYPEFLNKLDTTSTPYYLNGRKCNYLKNLNLQLDNTKYSNRTVAYVPDFGDKIPTDSIKTNSQKHIGTIAPDLFQNKILVIDFINNRLTTFDKLPKKYSKASFENAIIRKGRIKLPIKIGDSTEYVMFDTGSCLGDLLLDKHTITKYTDNNVQAKEFLNGSTWGETVAYFDKTLIREVYFNNRKLNITNAQFSNLDSDVQFNREEKIIGTIGPVIFSKNIIIIDYKNNRFGVL